METNEVKAFFEKFYFRIWIFEPRDQWPDYEQVIIALAVKASGASRFLRDRGW